jgi:hypothetical protein
MDLSAGAAMDPVRAEAVAAMRGRGEVVKDIVSRFIVYALSVRGYYRKQRRVSIAGVNTGYEYTARH